MAVGEFPDSPADVPAGVERLAGVRRLIRRRLRAGPDRPRAVRRRDGTPPGGHGPAARDPARRPEADRALPALRGLAHSLHEEAAGA
ncbi:hypothetical protein OG530_30475 [Streptomyces decoyicus]|uniref:hypothetical protein n=1 Tax=Streptomyces decoyicus TaxID=249567 RepID=UPI002E185693